MWRHARFNLCMCKLMHASCALAQPGPANNQSINRFERLLEIQATTPDQDTHAHQARALHTPHVHWSALLSARFANDPLTKTKKSQQGPHAQCPVAQLPFARYH